MQTVSNFLSRKSVNHGLLIWGDFFPFLTCPSSSFLWNWVSLRSSKWFLRYSVVCFFPQRDPSFSNFMFNLDIFIILEIWDEIAPQDYLREAHISSGRQKHLFFYAHILEKKMCVWRSVYVFPPLDPSGMQIRLFADLSSSMFGFLHQRQKKIYGERLILLWVENMPWCSP